MTAPRRWAKTSRRARRRWSCSMTHGRARCHGSTRTRRWDDPCRPQHQFALRRSGATSVATGGRHGALHRHLVSVDHRLLEYVRFGNSSRAVSCPTGFIRSAVTAVQIYLEALTPQPAAGQARSPPRVLAWTAVHAHPASSGGPRRRKLAGPRKPGLQLMGRYGQAHEVALGDIAAHVDQDVPGGPVLHPFGHHLHAEVMS